MARLRVSWVSLFYILIGDQDKINRKVNKKVFLLTTGSFPYNLLPKAIQL